MKKYILILYAAMLAVSCSKDEAPEKVDLNNVVVTGSLSDQINDENISKITHLTISGTISGEDWNTLFEMATMGSLEILDMTNAKIVGKADADWWNDDEIPQYEFSHSKTLKEVYLPTTLKVIGEEAFAECSKLTMVHFPERLDSIAPRAFHKSGLSGELSLPSHLRVIARQAFGWTKVTKVTINSDIMAGKTITQKEGTSGETSNYSSIYLVGGNSVFAYCENLSEVVVKEGCTKLEIGFQHCTSLSKVVLPSTLLTIGQFDKRIEKLMETPIPDNLEDLLFYSAECSIAGVYSGTNGNYVFKDCTALTEINLPEKLYYIGDDTFYGSSLKEIVIPNNVRYLWTGAFGKCESLGEIKMPSKLRYIGGNCFKGCTSLNAVVIPEEVFYIDFSAFADCSSLRTVSFGTNIMSVESQAFKDCTKLEEVRFSSKVLMIGKSAFEGCSGLTTAILSDNMTEIASSTFKDCIELQNVYIGNSIDTIRSSAFHHCPKLVSIKLPASINELESYSFAYSGLKEVLSINSTPPSVSNNVFEGINLLKAILFVPTGAKKAYQQADIWNTFGQIQEQ